MESKQSPKVAGTADRVGLVALPKLVDVFFGGAAGEDALECGVLCHVWGFRWLWSWFSYGLLVLRAYGSIVRVWLRTSFVTARRRWVRMQQFHPPRVGSLVRLLVLCWGVLGVVVILVDALWRLSGYAWTAIRSGEMGWGHWFVLGVWVVANAYMEGYRGFQRSFSPMVVERGFLLAQGGKWWQVLFAPAVCMALLSARRKRLIVSWVIVVLVVFLVITIRQVAQPWRGIVDAGVVVGLGWGTVSVVVFFVRALLGYAIPSREGNDVI